VRKWGSCDNWGSSVPPETRSEDRPGWCPVNYGNYSYTPPGGCTSCDGSVSGDWWRYGGDGKDGEWECTDTLKWEITVYGVDEECDKPASELCQKGTAECSKHEKDATEKTGSAVNDCVEAARKACDGKFTENLGTTSSVSPGAC